ncbi:MAG: hypothetical protein K0U78_15205 [Actinomycetia bacterium]|nr:hypothetical protein [Actinomycetes bacterium]
MNKGIKRSTITGENEDDTARPVQSINYFKRNTEAEIIFPYGVHANLPEGSLMVTIPILDQCSNLVAIGGMPNERIQVEQGEVVFFHPVTKAKIHFKNNGDIDIDSLDKDLNVSINNGTISASGGVTINVTGDANLTVDGELNVTAPTTNWDGDIVQTGTLVNDQTTSNGIPLDGHGHDGSPTAPDGPVTDTGASKSI